MRRLITFFPVCFIIGLLVLGLRAGEHSLFAPYLGDAPPQILEIIETKNEDSIEITRLRFLNRTLPDNSIVSIYGILARPAEKSARRPAILVCHGGGATADHVEPAVKHWASLGYVAFCQDEPGIADSKKCGQQDIGDRTEIPGDASPTQLATSSMTAFSQPSTDSICCAPNPMLTPTESV